MLCPICKENTIREHCKSPTCTWSACYKPHNIIMKGEARKVRVIVFNQNNHFPIFAD